MDAIKDSEPARENAGRVVAVQCAGGMWRDVARELAQEGARVALWGNALTREAQDEMWAAQVEIEAAGGVVIASAGEDAAALQWVVEAWGRVDVAIVWDEATGRLVGESTHWSQGKRVKTKLVVVDRGSGDAQAVVKMC